MSIFRKIKGILPFVHNRWIHPSHKVVITDPEFGIGNYHDSDHRLLYANFQLLVDYVEIECAALNSKYFSSDEQRVYELFAELPILHWFLPHYRNAKQGLHHLRWAMKQQECPGQAESARIMFDLYKFWKHDRPQRIDPWDEVPEVDITEMLDHAHKNGGKIRPLTKKEKKAYTNAFDIEAKYYEEDTEMLKLLIKHRNTLWT